MNEEDTRVDDSQYPSNPLATAASNELGPAVPGCRCPAAKGEDCPLTQDECDARTRDYIGHPWFGARLRRIYDGFVRESMNGVVCSIPDTGLDTPPHRLWCVNCQRRYMELKALVEMLESDGCGLRGDPVAPRTVNGEARDNESSSTDCPARARETVIAEVIQKIMARRTAASGLAVFVDDIILRDILEQALTSSSSGWQPKEEKKHSKACIENRQKDAGTLRPPPCICEGLGPTPSDEQKEGK